METLIRTIGIGLAAGGLAILVRALPWPAGWVKKKPLSCSGCLAFWCALPLLFIAHGGVPGGRIGLLTLLGAIAVVAAVHRYLHPPELEI